MIKGLASHVARQLATMGNIKLFGDKWGMLRELVAERRRGSVGEKVRHPCEGNGNLVRGGMFARRATFQLTIPTSAPDLPSHGEAPQVDHIALHTFPTKHVA